MARRIASASAVVGLIFLCTPAIFAQTLETQGEKQPAPRLSCSPAADLSECVHIDTRERPDLRTPSETMELGAVSVFGIKQSPAETGRSVFSFGGIWQLKSGISYRASGGVQVSASAIARRGYSLPITMAQPIGSDVLLSDS